MERRVYRSLDKPTEFFGIKGRFMAVMLLLTGMALMAGILVGGMTGMMAGTGAFLVLAAFAYMATLAMQAKVKEKDLVKTVIRRGLPRVYSVRPKHIRNIWKGFNLPAGLSVTE